jgi:aquaporin Z
MSQLNSLEIKKYTAELIGTLILVLAGCGSAVIGLNIAGNLGISFAFGLSVLVMVYTIGSISGCHINPAVSISMLAVGKLSIKDTIFYILFQCVGAIIGAGILYGITLGSIPTYNIAAWGLAQNGYASSLLAAAFAAEVVFTFIFVLVIHGATSKKTPKGFAGITIGLALTLVHLFLIPITNASVNPARSLGPALFVGGVALEQLWLFWVAPIIGGLLAALVWKVLSTESKTQTASVEEN